MSIFEKNQLALASRVRPALYICTTVFLFLLLRLWYLQVLQGEHFRQRSENNRLRTLFIAPPRGEILDRHGEVLVKNRPSFNIEFIREDSPDIEGTLTRLAQILDREPEDLHAAFISPQRRRERFEPRILLRDVSRDEVAKVAARRFELPGVVIRASATRLYVKGTSAAHVLGYIGEISAEQLNTPQYAGYRMGDFVGQYGVERTQEYFLQGQRGRQTLIVDARGGRVGEAFFEEARPGHNITLTIDAGVQAAAEKAMLERRGAVVALSPESGEVLAMLSKPAFDPNIFAAGISHEAWRELSTGSERRLNNRAVQGIYPPGSVFKAFVAVAGLAEGVVDSADQVNCPGSYRVGRSRAFHCHKRHGSMAMIAAMQKSCNVYFYTVGQRLGVDRIHDYSTRFGLGRSTGLVLVDEATGLIPSTTWKRENFSGSEARWYPGETPSVSIGQGAVAVTPLQIARAISALVNGGRVLRPYLVRSVAAQQGAFFDDLSGVREEESLGVEQWVLDEVRRGLEAAVEDEGGTGRRARLPESFGIRVGGKTGTAQLRQLRGTQKLAEEHSLAWFAGYAPAEAPEIVVVAMVEGGGAGGLAAAPVAGKVFEAWFRGRGYGLVEEE